jgi:hypothetical protein
VYRRPDARRTITGLKSKSANEGDKMPIQGNMGSIMRLPDPQKTPLRNPVPQGDDKGAMILGSRMTREDLLEYIRIKRREAEEKRNYQPPPPPPTERQQAQTTLEVEAGQRGTFRSFRGATARRSESRWAERQRCCLRSYSRAGSGEQG